MRAAPGLSSNWTKSTKRAGREESPDNDKDLMMRTSSLFGGHIWLGAGQKMTVEKKMNILAGNCGKKKLNNKIDRRWEKQRPVQKAARPPLFSQD